MFEWCDLVKCVDVWCECDFVRNFFGLWKWYVENVWYIFLFLRIFLLYFKCMILKLIVGLGLWRDCFVWDVLYSYLKI